VKDIMLILSVRNLINPLIRNGSKVHRGTCTAQQDLKNQKQVSPPNLSVNNSNEFSEARWECNILCVNCFIKQEKFIKMVILILKVVPPFHPNYPNEIKPA